MTAFHEILFPLDIALRSYGVNSGIGRSGKVLRRTLRLPDNTSVVTDEVVAAARAIDPRALITANTAVPRPLFAVAFIIYVWKVVVWDKVLGLGTTDALTGDVSQWATIVLTAYFGGRSLEKIVRVLMKK